MIAKVAFASHRYQPQDPRLAGHEEEMVLNAAYLVDEAGAAALRQAVDSVDIPRPADRADRAVGAVLVRQAGSTMTMAQPDRPVALVDLLDRLLAGGVVITGDITISLADVDLVHLSLHALISSVSDLDGTMTDIPSALRSTPTRPGATSGRLVLTIVELVRQLMERQAIRRVDAGDLSDDTVERLGLGLMRLEEAMDELRKHFGLRPEDLNLDLGPLGNLLPPPSHN